MVCTVPREKLLQGKPVPKVPSKKPKQTENETKALSVKACKLEETNRDFDRSARGTIIYKLRNFFIVVIFENIWSYRNSPHKIFLVTIKPLKLQHV